jgi:hypothetical protein
MEYRGIRYAIRAGIERGHWSVVIYPQGVETTGVKASGTRDHAELQARRLIKRWLQPKSQQARAIEKSVDPEDTSDHVPMRISSE